MHRQVWRYYLLANRPESADSKFLWTDLAVKNNTELLNNLGNFCHRTLTFMGSRLGGVMPALDAAHAAVGSELGAKVQPIVQEYVACLEKLKLKDGLRLAMKLSSAGNLFFQESQPWVALKQDKAKCDTILACCVGLVKVLAILLAPYMPTVAAKLTAQLGSPADMQLSDELVMRTAAPQSLLPAGHRLGTSEPMFRNIPDDEVEELRARFSGSQATDAANGRLSVCLPQHEPCPHRRQPSLLGFRR
jgi:methionyl-tRNA synthetase